MAQYPAIRRSSSRSLSLGGLVAALAVAFTVLSTLHGAGNAQVAITTVDLAPNTNANGVAVHPAADRVYVVNSGTGRISVVRRSDNGRSADITYGNSPTLAVIAPPHNALYVISQGNNKVGQINTVTNTISAEYDIISRPIGIAVNPGPNIVYVSSFNTSGSALPTITVIDGVTDTVLREIDASDGLQPGPRSLAFNPVTNRLYVAHLNGTVSVIDGSTYQILTNFSVADPTGGTNIAKLAVNTVTNRVYVGKSGGTIMTIDGATNAVSAPYCCVGPISDLTVNETLNRIYTTNFPGQALHVVDAVSLTSTMVPLSTSSPLGVATDAATGRVYVAHFTGPSKLTVLEDAAGPIGNTATPTLSTTATVGGGSPSPTSTATATITVLASTPTGIASPTGSPTGTSVNTPTVPATSTPTETRPTVTGTVPTASATAPATSTIASTATSTATTLAATATAPTSTVLTTSTATLSVSTATGIPTSGAIATPTFFVHSGGAPRMPVYPGQHSPTPTSVIGSGSATSTPTSLPAASVANVNLTIVGGRSVSPGQAVRLETNVPNDGQQYEVRMYPVNLPARTLAEQVVTPTSPLRFAAPGEGQYRFGLFRNGVEVARTVSLLVFPNSAFVVSPGEVGPDDDVNLRWNDLRTGQGYSAVLQRTDGAEIDRRAIVGSSGSVAIDLGSLARPVAPGSYRYVLVHPDLPGVQSNAFNVQRRTLALRNMIRLNEEAFLTVGNQAQVEWSGANGSGYELRLMRFNLINVILGGAALEVDRVATPTSAGGVMPFPVQENVIYKFQLAREGNVVAESPGFVTGQPRLEVSQVRANAGQSVSVHYRLPATLEGTPLEISLHPLNKPEQIEFDWKMTSGAEGSLEFRAPDPRDPRDFNADGSGWYDFRLSVNQQSIPLAPGSSNRVYVTSPTFQIGSRSVVSGDPNPIGGQAIWVDWQNFTPSSRPNTENWIGLYPAGSQNAISWAYISDGSGHMGFYTPTDELLLELRFYADSTLVTSLPFLAWPLNQEKLADMSNQQRAELLVNLLFEDSPAVFEYLNSHLTPDQVADIIALNWLYEGSALADWITTFLTYDRAAEVIAAFERRR